MKTATEVKVEAPSFLAMSDDEIMKAMSPDQVKVPVVAAVPEVETPAAGTEGAAGADATADDAGDKDEGEGAAAGAADETGAKPGEKAADDASQVDDKDPTKVKAPADTKVDPEAKDTKTETPDKVDAPQVDFEAEYKRLLTPFKANGREIQVNSVDDAISLMQMGANYNKKMAALKPNLKLMKMLENNGFMSEEKIGFLIDLGKKDPAAINKLVKESGIDPMDLDAEKASAYKQTAYAVDDREIELDTVLDELQGSPAYTRTLDVVSNKWDVASKQVVTQSPQLLKVINDHVASGIYDLISTEVERERLFGRLTGLSDIEAYRQVGDSIQARGGFNHLVKNQGNPKPAAAAPVIVQPKPKVDDDKLKEKKRAASSAQPVAPSAGVAKDFNPLALSDDEFLKLATPKFT